MAALPLKSVQVSRQQEVLTISGPISDGWNHRLLAAIHQGVEVGFEELTLDMHNVSHAAPGGMVQICAQALALRNGGMSFRLLLPADRYLERLFLNVNWAHLIDPRRFDPREQVVKMQVPATQYQTASQQREIVNRVLDAVLATVEDLDRSEIAALEWSLNEITDNVLVHAKSAVGGVVQVTRFPRRKTIAFAVADAGVGIPNSLREGHPEIRSDAEALERAVREGVTRDKSIGQGNGLFGTLSICQKGDGRLYIDAGYATLQYDPRKQLHIRAQPIPYEGTLVVCDLDFSKPGLLKDALRIDGKQWHLIDFLETRYEQAEGAPMRFVIADEATSFGSRAAGEPVRRKLLNIARMTNAKKVQLDFKGIPLVSSSFADELIGKLFVEMGPLAFMGRFELTNVESTVRSLLDKAVSQRMKTGL
jgi:anti-sigma regulatory factor (Ser/Thr protein kinase)